MKQRKVLMLLAVALVAMLGYISLSQTSHANVNTSGPTCVLSNVPSSHPNEECSHPDGSGCGGGSTSPTPPQPHGTAWLEQSAGQGGTLNLRFNSRHNTRQHRAVGTINGATIFSPWSNSNVQSSSNWISTTPNATRSVRLEIR